MARRGKPKTLGEKLARDPRFRKFLLWGLVSLLVVGFSYALYDQFQSLSSAPQSEDEMSKTLGAMEEVMKAEKISATATDPFSVGARYTQSSDPAIRIKGLNMVMAADQARGGRIAQALLTDPDASVQIAAIRQLQQFQVAGSGAHIVRLLDSANPTLRSAATSGMASFTTEGGILDKLQQPLSSRDPGVASDAIRVWSMFAPQDRRSAFRVIRRAATSADNAVRLAALAAIQGLAPTPQELQMMGIKLETQ